MNKFFPRWRGLLTKRKRDMIIAHNDAILVILFCLFIYLLVKYGRQLTDFLIVLLSI